MALLSVRLLWVAVALLLWSPHAHCREFTHEDIREALLSLVHMMRMSEDKLERHEFREKALGEQLKRMLGGLDKKHRALEPLKGTISRLDERLSNVETIILQKDEREKSFQQKIHETLENIQKSLVKLTPEAKSPEIDNRLLGGDDALQRRMDATDAKIDMMTQEIKSLKNSLSQESLRAMCLVVASDMNPFESHISEAEKLLNKYELKLNEYNGTANKVQTDFVLNEVSLADEAWHSKMSEVMERQEKEVRKIQQLLSDAESMWKDLPRRSDLNRSTNMTIEAVTNTTEAIIINNEMAVSRMSTKLKDMGDRLEGTNEDIQKSLTQSNTMTERAYNDITRSYESLRAELQLLSKNEQVIQDTADNVVVTRKRIEHGVQQILMQVAELIKSQQNHINKTVDFKLEDMEEIITNNQTSGLNNLGAKIESEMSQVWRQIGIMHQQITTNQQALQALAASSEQYVNSSTATMDKVKKQVESIDEKIFQLKDDLNYFLGRLSLMTQEFKQMTSGLNTMLTNNNKSTTAAPAVEAPTGPGPHNITSDEITT